MFPDSNSGTAPEFESCQQQVEVYGSYRLVTAMRKSGGIAQSVNAATQASDGRPVAVLSGSAKPVNITDLPLVLLPVDVLTLTKRYYIAGGKS